MNADAQAPAQIPPERSRRNPMLSLRGWAHLDRILQHPHAPRWNAAPGDGVAREDLDAVDVFRSGLSAWAGPSRLAPGLDVLEATAKALLCVPLYRERSALAPRWRQEWATLPTSSREDLATRMEEMVPDDADLEGLSAHETSGTTGHAIHVPTHARAIASSHALIERVLSRVGVDFRPAAGRMACVNLCARARTWAFSTVFSVWGEAGFAKVNLADADWAGGRGSARAFFDEWRPPLWTGDPTAFAEALAWDLGGSPAALLSTATALEPVLAEALSRRYECPIIDWYSTTETGPIAWRLSRETGFEIVSPDLYVEVIDEEGRPAPEGERGEIAVSGGRNPFLPLVRYRTGDTARLVRASGSAGGSTLRLVDLEGRRAVHFRRPDGSALDAADVGRELRARSALVQHECVQRLDGTIDIRVRLLPGSEVDAFDLETGICGLLGPAARVHVRVDPTLGVKGKVVPYAVEPWPAHVG